jgi:hypothetical protein
VAVVRVTASAAVLTLVAGQAAAAALVGWSFKPFTWQQEPTRAPLVAGAVLKQSVLAVRLVQ